MKLEMKAPFMITSRLMAGIKIGDAYISIGYLRISSEGRTVYDVWIDLPKGKPHHDTTLKSGVGGGTLQEGMESLLSFLGAAADAYQYETQNPKRESDNSDLFPKRINAWAYKHSDSISMLCLELEETPNLIQESA